MLDYIIFSRKALYSRFRFLFENAQRARWKHSFLSCRCLCCLDTTTTNTNKCYRPNPKFQLILTVHSKNTCPAPKPIAGLSSPRPVLQYTTRELEACTEHALDVQQGLPCAFVTCDRRGVSQIVHSHIYLPSIELISIVSEHLSPRVELY